MSELDIAIGKNRDLTKHNYNITRLGTVKILVTKSARGFIFEWRQLSFH